MLNTTLKTEGIMTGIDRIEPIKRLEQKFIEEIKSKHEEEKKDDEMNRLYKDRIRDKMIEKIDNRPAGEILKETFVLDEKIN